MATVVAIAFMRNITAKQPTVPKRENIQCTLNLGLKDGLSSNVSIPEVRLSVP